MKVVVPKQRNKVVLMVAAVVVAAGLLPMATSHYEEQAEEKTTIVRRLSSDDANGNLFFSIFFLEVCEEYDSPFDELEFITKNSFFLSAFLGALLGNLKLGSCVPICQDLCNDKDGYQCGRILSEDACGCLKDEPLASRSSIQSAVELYCKGGDARECIEEKHGPIELWDTSKVVDMRFGFLSQRDCNPNITEWELSSVATTRGMFQNAETFNQPIDDWNVTSVTDMDEMFKNAAAFNQNLCSWGEKINLTATSTTDMFVGTSCPNTQGPNLTATPPGPFCYDC